MYDPEKSDYWQQLHDLDGTEEISALLAQICDPDDLDSPFAVRELRRLVCHQRAAISRETAYVLPLLLEIAKARASTAHSDVVDLIAAILECASSWRRARERAAVEYKENYDYRVRWEHALASTVRALDAEIRSLFSPVGPILPNDRMRVQQAYANYLTNEEACNS
ncbi:hypothetical protein [Yinghuangia sp. YIM S09857]|uniref:hypothetical protein n=1 Tax=Yinghuangia sp. YIM S09857 TaxID=3436929 RepID=UPI003F53B64B